MYTLRTVFQFILLFSFVQISFGQVVTIDRVKFDSLDDDWLLCEVDTTTRLNDMAGAKSKRFVENVEIGLYLGFKNLSLNNKLDFYFSKVTALILEKGDKNTVRFYIPGNLMEMKRYKKPDFYYAEININNTSLKPSARARSTNLSNERALNNFVKKARAESFKNAGRLIPSYLAPFSIVGADLEAPTYLRVRN